MRVKILANCVFKLGFAWFWPRHQLPPLAIFPEREEQCIVSYPPSDLRIGKGLG